ncbi:phosphoribosylformylglycinamidine synthase subunit PurS [Dietzia sp. NCCP-2495]|nr:phosphoribosylformylglycinamidine synthase subunit PurS [Dietzia sp. NCCP-2495]
MPKAEILDPQGQAIHRALGRLGHAGVTDVRQGKRFELEVADDVTDAQLEEIAESLLANTVIEDWKVVRAEVVA